MRKVVDHVMYLDQQISDTRKRINKDKADLHKLMQERVLVVRQRVGGLYGRRDENHIQGD